MEENGEEQEDGSNAPACVHPYLQVHNPSFDYVPPALISLFLTGQYVYWYQFIRDEISSSLLPHKFHIPSLQTKGMGSCQAMFTGSCTSTTIRLIGEHFTY